VDQQTDGSTREGEQANRGSTAAAKNENTSAKRIFRQLLLAELRQGIDPFSAIDRLDRYQHPHLRCNLDHRSGYRACLGIQSLAKAYSHPRLEAACRRALEGQACSYPSLKSILKRGLDGHPTLAQEAERSSPRHENLRGGHYYLSPTKLVQ
jgi:hypothetical protein